jgi:hypothetical protein
MEEPEILPILTDDGLVLPASAGGGRVESGLRSGDSGSMPMVNPHLKLALDAPPLSGAIDEEAPMLVLTDDGLVDPITRLPPKQQPQQQQQLAPQNIAAIAGAGLTLHFNDQPAPIFTAPPNDLISPTFVPPAMPEPVVTPQSINQSDSDIPVLTDDGLVTKSGALLDSKYVSRACRSVRPLFCLHTRSFIRLGCVLRFSADLNVGRASGAVPFGLKLAIPPPSQPYRNVLSNTDPKRASIIMSNRRASMLSQNGKAGVIATGGGVPGGATGLSAVMAGLAAAAAAGNIGPASNAGAVAPPPPFGLGGMKLKIDIKAEVNPNARSTSCE